MYRLLLTGYWSYRSLISLIKRKSIFPSYGCVSITVWIHQLGTNETQGENVRGELQKNAMLYSHLPPILQTIQIKQRRHTGHWWRSRKPIVNVLLCIPTRGYTSIGQLADPIIFLSTHFLRGPHGVMAIIIGNRNGNTSSNPEWGHLHFI